VKSGTREKIVIQSDPWDKQYKPGFRRQAENAINAVKGLPHSLPNLDDGIETMRLVQQIYAT
jgi:predicted dehydrogenase